MKRWPLARYQAMVAEGRIEADPAQAALAQQLDRLARALDGYRPGRRPSALGRLIGAKPPTPPRGLYIHGPVGRGKTLLMDLLFDAAPVEKKRRAHFHEFMADVHMRVHRWRQQRRIGEASGDEPIAPIAATLAAEALAPLLRRIRGARHRRCDDPRPAVHRPVRRRRGRRCDFQCRAGRPLSRRAQSRPVPAVHQAARRKARRRRARGAHRLPAEKADARAGLLLSCRSRAPKRRSTPPSSTSLARRAALQPRSFCSAGRCMSRKPSTASRASPSTIYAAGRSPASTTSLWRGISTRWSSIAFRDSRPRNATRRGASSRSSTRSMT